MLLAPILPIALLVSAPQQIDDNVFPTEITCFMGAGALAWRSEPIPVRSAAEAREVQAQWQDFAMAQGKAMLTCGNPERTRFYQANSAAFANAGAVSWRPRLKAAGPVPKPKPTPNPDMNQPCAPKRSLAGGNELRCTNRGEIEFGYCYYRWKKPDGVPDIFYVSRVFKQVWDGPGNALVVNNTRSRFEKKVEEAHYIEPPTETFCEYAVTRTALQAKLDTFKYRARDEHVVWTEIEP